MTFHLSQPALDWALKHLEAFGDSDIFPTPFEIQAIRHDWDAVRSFLVKQDIDTWKTRAKRSALTPKGRYSYRIATQLDPLDILVFLAIVYEVGEDLEQSRVAKNDKTVFSYRFEPSVGGQLYDSKSTWSTFIRRSEELAELARSKFVVVTDISDFYPRLYQHRIRNALDKATGMAGHVRVLDKLLRQWSDGASYGLPVGPAASRLVAEVSLNDADDYLRAEGVTFVRFLDDYRIFCKSRKQAYERLSGLANVLFQNHGLSLQPGKTFICDADEYINSRTSSPESEELSNLIDNFEQLAEAIELENPYDDINYDDLDEDQRELVDKLNLRAILDHQLEGEDLDISLFRFVLRRLTQLNDPSVALKLLSNAEQCYSVIAPIMDYIVSLDGLTASKRHRLGNKLVSLVRRSLVGHLPFHRCWLLSAFAGSGDWAPGDRIVPLLAELTDPFSQRKLILGLGRADEVHWFRARRSDVLQLEPWQRRAFLAAASCMAKDERKHWYGFIHGQLDELEKAVVAWAQSNPY